MKTALLSIFVLLAMLGSAEAREIWGKPWEYDFRRCRVSLDAYEEQKPNANRPLEGETGSWISYRSREDGSDEINQIMVFIGADFISDLEKALTFLKKCRKFSDCLDKRDAGKVKHCYIPRGIHD
jgi:hypothetical protein